MPYDPTLAKLRRLRTNTFNLMTMLDIACKQTGDKEILEGITKAVSYQFSLEVTTFKDLGVQIPEAHLLEHKTLLEEIKLREEKWREGMVSSELFAEEIKMKLFFHIETHDKPLADSILNP